MLKVCSFLEIILVLLKLFYSQNIFKAGSKLNACFIVTTAKQVIVSNVNVEYHLIDYCIKHKTKLH